MSHTADRARGATGAPRLAPEPRGSHLHDALVLELWRDVSRSTSRAEILERILARTGSVLPIRALLIARAEGESLVRVAVAPGARPPAEGEPAIPFERARRLFLEARVASGRPARLTGAGTLLPPGLQGRFLLGALEAAGEPIGAAAFVGTATAEFTPEHVAIAERLLEPLGFLLERSLGEGDAPRPSGVARARASGPAGAPRALRPDAAEGAIVGERQGLRAVMDLVVRAAPADVPVLIMGETGSGKEVVARAIHERSARASGPLVRVNCGAIPTELVDSELFGHERGSFTGAVATRRGWFERADGGTLFLDEIGELPLAAQVRLLRVLQDGTFERVGGQTPRSVDVRIVAATHRDLSEMVATGQFRRDLWYRLNVFPIHLPPLRARRDDIGLFATHFAALAGERLFGAPAVPTEEDIALLRDHPWPGNVRELAAVIERAALLGGGRCLEVAQALAAPPAADGVGVGVAGRPHEGSAPVRPAPQDARVQPEPGTAPVGHAVRPLEAVLIEHIERALLATSGRIEGSGGAAALLGVNPHTLRARMRKLRIDWTRFRRGAAPTGE
ncbi:sigma-54 interaction domain-containing protein [Anaeromyxobacter oryzae]|nr:sigma-54 dependent transcriptional regulator [Anaeromyxobacter oryzae]